MNVLGDQYLDEVGTTGVLHGFMATLNESYPTCSVHAIASRGLLMRGGVNTPGVYMGCSDGMISW